MTAIEFVWDGKAMVPASAFWAKRAAKEYAEGEVVPLVQHEARSTNSHNHYFATVTEAWRNLPEDMAARFPTADHLRKFALIRTGWHHSRCITCASESAANETAAFIEPLDEFALVNVTGSVVTVFTAKTQSYRMGKQDFQKSKTDVLEFLAFVIGVTAPALSDAGKAA